MLTIERKPYLKLPTITVLTPMEFSPVVDDDDELTLAIAQDSADRDNTWTLEETPDTGALHTFWSEVEEDVRSDPKWFSFSEE